VPDPLRVERSQLNIEHKLGEGGQGRVWQLADGRVYKEYLDPSVVVERELLRLVNWREALPAMDREFCDRTFAWPRQVVMRLGKPVGFIMPAVPPEFYCSFSVSASQIRRLSEVQLLMFPRKRSWTGVPKVDLVGRLSICRDAVAAVHLLHRGGLILGDISMANILWCSVGGSCVFFLDCDGIRKLSFPTVVPQTSTPDWHDPLDPTRATLSSDRYKLALLIGRIVSNSYRWHPGDALPSSGGVLERLQALTDMIPNVSKFDRPSTEEWLAAFDGRPLLKLI
jgi:hypothetical protein